MTERIVLQLQINNPRRALTLSALPCVSTKGFVAEVTDRLFSAHVALGVLWHEV